MAFPNNPKPFFAEGGRLQAGEFVSAYDSTTSTNLYLEGQLLIRSSGTWAPCTTNSTPIAWAIQDCSASTTTLMTHEKLYPGQEIYIKCSTTPTTANLNLAYELAVSSNVHTLNLSATSGGVLVVKRLVYDPAGTMTNWVVASLPNA